MRSTGSESYSSCDMGVHLHCWEPLRFKNEAACRSKRFGEQCCHLLCTFAAQTNSIQRLSSAHTLRYRAKPVPWAWQSGLVQYAKCSQKTAVTKMSFQPSKCFLNFLTMLDKCSNLVRTVMIIQFLVMHWQALWWRCFLENQFIPSWCVKPQEHRFSNFIMKAKQGLIHN